jgi:hypothetical protein
MTEMKQAMQLLAEQLFETIKTDSKYSPKEINKAVDETLADFLKNHFGGKAK